MMPIWSILTPELPTQYFSTRQIFAITYSLSSYREGAKNAKGNYKTSRP